MEVVRENLEVMKAATRKEGVKGGTSGELIIDEILI